MLSIFKSNKNIVRYLVNIHSINVVISTDVVMRGAHVFLRLRARIFPNVRFGFGCSCLVTSGRRASVSDIDYTVGETIGLPSDDLCFLYAVAPQI